MYIIYMCVSIYVRNMYIYVHTRTIYIYVYTYYEALRYTTISP
jgi:hypothetical protein